MCFTSAWLIQSLLRASDSELQPELFEEFFQSNTEKLATYSHGVGVKTQSVKILWLWVWSATLQILVMCCLLHGLIIRKCYFWISWKPTTDVWAAPIFPHNWVEWVQKYAEVLRKTTFRQKLSKLFLAHLQRCVAILKTHVTHHTRPSQDKLAYITQYWSNIIITSLQSVINLNKTKKR